jgi:UDP-glucose 4-epimerase
MRVLVTGGAGYVGSVSVEALVAAGHDVTVVDDLSTGHRAAVVDGASLVDGPYTDVEAMAMLLEARDIEAVLHCAARSLVGQSLQDPGFYFRENVAGGIALLEAMRSAGTRRIVFSSTAAVYGIPTATPIPEDAPLAPINPYGETKRSLEGALRWYGTAYGFRAVTLRYFNVAGASERNGEQHDPETHLIPNALIALEGGRPLTVFGDDYPTPDGTCIRDYIHVLDLADAHEQALEATAEDDSRTDPGATGGLLALNLGSGGGFSVREVLDATAGLVGREVPHSIGPRRAGDPPVLVASNARAADVLGWKPARSTLEEMIGSAWAWRQRHPAGYDEAD